MRNVPGPISPHQEVVDAVVGFLLGTPFLAEEVDDVVIDAHGAFFVIGEDVVLSVCFFFCGFWGLLVRLVGYIRYVHG